MKIQDRYDRESTLEFRGGITVFTDDGIPLFDITTEGTAIEIRALSFCTVAGSTLADSLVVAPVSTNVIRIERPEYKKEHSISKF